MRQAAGRPDVELVAECQFINPSKATAVHGDGRAFDDGIQIPEGSQRIGPFSLGNIDDYQAVYADMERGVWHALGLRVANTISFEMDRWMAELRGS
ncbi:hypothetical protein [Methylobacterium sp. SD21]|uniref:hypothetical protein n=1 Tax=Methylobacterium litchii TaxID=3138810 RepID=UPI00313D58D7